MIGARIRTSTKRLPLNLWTPPTHGGRHAQQDGENGAQEGDQGGLLGGAYDVVGG